MENAEIIKFQVTRGKIFLKFWRHWTKKILENKIFCFRTALLGGRELTALAIQQSKLHSILRKIIIKFKIKINDCDRSWRWVFHEQWFRAEFGKIDYTVEIVYNDGQGNWEFRRYIRLSL